MDLPQFSESPRAIAGYSDVDGIIQYNSTTALRRFVGISVNICLSQGVDVNKDMSPTGRRLDPVVEACLLSGTVEKRMFLMADVVTRRGVLTQYDIQGDLTTETNQIRCCRLTGPYRRDVEFNISLIYEKLFIEKHYIRDAGPM